MTIEVSNASFPVENPSSGSSFITVENDQLKTKHSDGSIKVYSTGITPEEVRDIIGVMVTDTNTIDLTYDDANDTLSGEVKDNSITNLKLIGGIDAAKIASGTVNNTEFSYLDGVTSNIQTQLNNKEPANSNIQSHISNTSNPHNTTAAQVGADPTGTASGLMTSHINAVDPHPQYTTVAEASAAAPIQSVAGKTGVVTLSKSDVGLGNVDNTSDVNKPISTAVQTALNNKLDSSQKGAANGIATLDATIKIPVAQIPQLSHSSLSNLTADDHTQYHNDARGDVRYYTKDQSDNRFAAYEHTHSIATQSVAGFMSASDKLKIDTLTTPTLVKTTVPLYSSSNVTFTNITELTKTCVAGKTYRFEIWLAYISAATATGIAVSMNIPSGIIAANASGLVAANGTAAAYHGYIGYTNQPVILSGTPSTSYNHLVKIDGIFICSGAGVMYPQFRSEVNGSQITVIEGSMAMINEI